MSSRGARSILGYEWTVVRRAWRDWRQRDRHKVLLEVLAVIAFGSVTAIWPLLTKVTLPDLAGVWNGIVAAGVLGLFLFLLRLIPAPAAIYREQESQIRALEKADSLRTSEARNAAAVLIEVTRLVSGVASTLDPMMNVVMPPEVKERLENSVSKFEATLNSLEPDLRNKCLGVCHELREALRTSRSKNKYARFVKLVKSLDERIMPELTRASSQG